MYPAAFFIHGHYWKWTVMSRYAGDNICRPEAGPFIRRMTAERIRQTLEKIYRNGFDMGKKDGTADA